MVTMQIRRLALSCLAVAALAPIARAADDAKPIVLFDGKSLDHWHQAGPGKFDLHDGMMTAVGGMGLLWNDRPLANFTAHVEFKVEKPTDNSGVFVRFPDPGNDPWIAVNQGHEIQICDAEPKNHTGAVYNFQDSTTVASKPAGEWNDLDITVVGRHYTIAVNGKVVNDYTSDRLERGYLGVQNHFNPVSFRKVTVTELPGPSAAEAVGQPVTVADPAAGLVGRYYADLRELRQLDKPSLKPFFVRVDPSINFRPSDGDFQGSHLSDNFAVRWTGALHVEKPGTYTIDLGCDDGAVLTIAGKVAVDNGGMHKFKSKSGQVNFAAAGDYLLQLDYQQGSNEAGVVLKWQPPGSTRLANVPASAFVHASAEEKVDWDKSAWLEAAAHHREFVKAKGKTWERMDYGPFLSGTFDAAEPKGNTALKGIIVSLDKNQTTNVLFDTETMRYAAGWTGDFIDFRGVAYDGRHVDTPKVVGTQVFGTAVMPGWADARRQLQGPPRPPGRQRPRPADHAGRQPAVDALPRAVPQRRPGRVLVHGERRGRAGYAGCSSGRQRGCAHSHAPRRSFHDSIEIRHRANRFDAAVALPTVFDAGPPGNARKCERRLVRHNRSARDGD